MEKRLESGLKTEEDFYIRPRKANKKMKAAQTMSQTVYMYGISGCGKTAFIRDYMGKRRYHYYSAEQLDEEELDFPLNEKQIIVVIDELHQLRTDELREALIKKIEILARRQDVWLILAGRSRLPSWLSPIYYRKVFTVIEEEDFLLSEAEMMKYLNCWGITPTQEDFDTIMRLSYRLGIVVRLVAMELASGRSFDATYIERMRNDFWDYLDCHVYDQWEIEIQEFLMQVCIVEKFDKHLAEMITGRSDVEKMIGTAEQLGNFMIFKEADSDKRIYEIRLPMRRSMRRRLLRTYQKERWERLYYNAGLYYELEGDTPNALKMYEACHDTERIAGLLISNARKNPASGHYYELRKYYLALPEEKIRESMELIAGMSMLQSMLLSIEESEHWYEELMNLESSFTGSAKKVAKGWLVYLDIGLPHRGSMALVDILKNAGSLLMKRKISLPEFSVTSNLPSQMNGGKDFCEWSKKDKELAKSIGKIIEFTLGKYGKGLVNLALAESFLEKGEDSYEITNLTNKGLMQAQSGGKIEQCFVAAGILSWLHVLNDHVEDAKELLLNFQKKAEEKKATKLLPNLTALQIRIGLYQGKTAEALEWMEQAPEEELVFATMERFRYLTKVRIYLLTGKYEKAISLLQRLQYYAEVMKRTYITMEVGLLLAITQYRLGNSRWDEIFQKTLTQAESYYFVRLISREGAAVSKMLKETSWESKNPEYLKEILAETEKMALAYPGYLKVATEEAVFSENALKILKLQAEGLSTAEIAGELGLKIENVKYHNKQNFKKLGVNSKTAAVNEARKRKLI
ncbi:LuxR C-terminal-related transcriptional regulator [Anaerosacchariphilus polymeriproducens]|uniref:LuxR family transcriptional regulator n=1 Tax=Anaerosacchariphilus polymeriproducens TaxID=1812858 RepID=A0A371AZA0_9FIRM|nr:LuxR C-terminal-related transcriptional regulator [Anaerosacchariphilus polymeriproducens]RDU24887.1 LuxR family transcriptional regulator [Anaerosacchariphilus polymeriproducens]